MHPKFKNKNRGGFIKMIIIIVGALVVLKYAYNVDVIGFLTQGWFREVLDKFYSLGSKGWDKYSNFILTVWDYLINFAKNLLAKIK